MPTDLTSCLRLRFPLPPIHADICFPSVHVLHLNGQRTLIQCDAEVFNITHVKYLGNVLDQCLIFKHYINNLVGQPRQLIVMFNF